MKKRTFFFILFCLTLASAAFAQPKEISREEFSYRAVSTYEYNLDLSIEPPNRYAPDQGESLNELAR